MPCMCGDYMCPSCGPAQGNSQCPICGTWASEGCDCIPETNIESPTKDLLISHVFTSLLGVNDSINFAIKQIEMEDAFIFTYEFGVLTTEEKADIRKRLANMMRQLKRSQVEVRKFFKTYNKKGE